MTQETFDALARRRDESDPYPHLRRADLLVIAPLTANTLAKLARGLADNVLTEAVFAHDGQVLVAPAMNHRMWAAPGNTRERRAAPRARRRADRPGGRRARRGRVRSRPDERAGGDPRARAQILEPGPLAGKRVLVSAGGTREPLDSVRFVGNRSSGRMGVALAEEARRRGADVTLLGANLAVAAPHGVTSSRRRRQPTSRGRRSSAPTRTSC